MNDASPVPAVQLRGVRKSYDGRVVLDDVSVTVPRGEFFAILGPSGSGKSTLLKMVSGIETPDAGIVWLTGKDVTAAPPFRRPVHTVFQNYALFPHLDVAGSVAFPLRVGKAPRSTWGDRVERALQCVQMEQHSARRVTELSGGERQRVALARALVDEPECVLLDEPMSALDPHLRVQTLQLLKDIQSRLRATYLYVTHDREEALRAAHRIGVMHSGRLVQVGAPEEIYHRPESPFVAGFIGPINWLAGMLYGDGHSAAVSLSNGHEIPCTTVGNSQPRRVLLGVRPECIRLADGFLPAEVVERQFSGASVTLRLSVDPQTILVAEVSADSNPPRIGTRVRLGWDPADVHLFADDGEQSTGNSRASRIDGKVAASPAAAGGRAE